MILDIMKRDDSSSVRGVWFVDGAVRFSCAEEQEQRGVRYTAVSRGRGCERFSNFDPYQSYLLKKLREKQVESVIDPLFCFSETHQRQFAITFINQPCLQIVFSTLFE